MHSGPKEHYSLHAVACLRMGLKPEVTEDDLRNDHGDTRRERWHRYKAQETVLLNAINSGLLPAMPHPRDQYRIEYRYIRSFLILQRDRNAAHHFFNQAEIDAVAAPGMEYQQIEEAFLNSEYFQKPPRAAKAPSVRNVAPLNKDIPKPLDTFNTFQAACTLLDVDPDTLQAAMADYSEVLHQDYPGHFDVIGNLNDELTISIISGELAALQDGMEYVISYAALRSYAIRQGIVPHLLFNEIEFTLRNFPARPSTGFELASQHFLHSEPLPADSTEPPISTPEDRAMPEETTHKTTIPNTDEALSPRKERNYLKLIGVLTRALAESKGSQYGNRESPVVHQIYTNLLAPEIDMLNNKHSLGKSSVSDKIKDALELLESSDD